MNTKNVTAMYDTVNFILFKDEYPHIDFIDSLPQYLSKVSTSGESYQGPYVIGFLDTYSVSINRSRVKIQNSSLAKYINHDNQQGMTLQQTKKALEKMSDQLHLNMDEAKITRIDIAKNIITKLSPEFYFHYLGELQGYRRLEVGDGLIFKNSLRELVFYNKIKEQKYKRQEIQTVFQGHNLLRYELKLKNHLEKELNQARVIGKLLYDESFYIHLAKFWRDEYFKIQKKSNKTNCIEPTGSTKELTENLAFITLKEIGEQSLFQRIAQWQEIGTITRKQAADHRKFIRKTIQKEMKENGNELIEELDKKIKESIRFFI